MGKHYITITLMIITVSLPNHFASCYSDYQYSSAPLRSPATANVDDFGAKGDGKDDSEAFRMAWRVACSSQGGVLLVPRNRVYHLKPITFLGPCFLDTTIKIRGTIKAWTNESDYNKDRRYWLLFDKIQNLKVAGGGIINGNGNIWWKQSCKINQSLPCKEAPTAVTFNGSRNLKLQGFKIKNAQQMHLRIQNSVNVEAVNLVISAPGSSPNTDGIHVTDSDNVRIANSRIRTGDDCISIVSGSKNVYAKDIVCGPGHGISIGSLGKGNSEAKVSNVLVSGVRLSGTTNGARIKTWVGGRGYVKNIIFQNMAMHNVSNPILIDQNYCDQLQPCPTKGSGVQISNVVYSSIKGTSASQTAIKLDCSSTSPCQGVRLQNIDLMSEEGHGESTASCVNVRATDNGLVFPTCNSF